MLLDKKLLGCLAEWSKALALGASPRGRGFEPHSNQTLASTLFFLLRCENSFGLFLWVAFAFSGRFSRFMAGQTRADASLRVGPGGSSPAGVRVECRGRVQ